MCPDRTYLVVPVPSPGGRSRGFALPSAIFLMVVLALLGTFAVRTITMQQRASMLDVQGTQAYQAARAGVEWGLVTVLRPAAGPCFGPQPLAVNGYTVTVTCARRTYTEGANPVNTYQVVATACNQPANGVCPNPAPAGANYVERQIDVRAEHG